MRREATAPPREAEVKLGKTKQRKAGEQQGWAGRRQGLVLSCDAEAKALHSSA